LSFWNAKKILITGAGGFVGSNLAKALLNLGADVFTFSSRPLPKNSLLVLEGLDSRIVKHVIGHALEIDCVDSVVRDNGIEVIFHLAAQPLVDLGRQNPIKTFEANIRGAWNFLEVARRNEVEKFVIASTMHVYGENPNLPFMEEFFPQPSRPYETSKACADLIAQCFADTYSVPIEIPRFVNLFGPGDMNFSRIIPKVIKSVLNGENPELWDVHAMRDFLFIDDAIRGYIALVEKGRPNEKRVTVMNFGSSRLVNVIDLAKTIIRLVGNPSVNVNLIKVPEGRMQEIAEQYVSIDKAKRELNWEPIYSLEKGLEISLEWYEKYLLKNNQS
jgi:CDP-glucose 4,6-dehydratase